MAALAGSIRFLRLTRLSVLAAFVLAAVVVSLAPHGARAQGMPSGEYGELVLGGSVQGSIAAATPEQFTYHTYVLRVPAGSGPVTLRVDGQGSDLDLAVKFGAPIVDYEDVDHLDISEDPNPTYTVQAPSGGLVYIDVLNLVQRTASYVLTATAGSGPTPTPTPTPTPPSPNATPGQPAPSGEYGAVTFGGSVEGTIAAAQDQVVYHTYVVDVPAGTSGVTVAVDGMGSDLDLAVKIGAPITDYEDVDYLDTSEDPNPRVDLTVAGPQRVWVDVINLVASPASYRLSVLPSGSDPAPQPDNPLGGGGGGANPLASDPLVGTFVGDGLQVIVTGGGGTYQGELVLGAQRYAFQASGGNGRLDGAFSSGGQSFAFSAALSGDTLTVQSGGATYRTVRTADGSRPAPGPSPSPTPSPANDPVIAQGPYGTLTQDNALAFFEALVFAHEQVGYPVTLTQQELDQYIAAAAQAYPTFSPDEQAGLAMSREVWNRVQARWADAAPADQREFVIGMLAMWYGDDQVAQWFGGGSAGGGGGGDGSCSDIDACFSQYADPETYSDAMNAQSCWAAAGCSDYDAGSNTFTYDDYSYDYSTDY